MPEQVYAVNSPTSGILRPEWICIWGRKIGAVFPSRASGSCTVYKCALRGIHNARVCDPGSMEPQEVIVLRKDDPSGRIGEPQVLLVGRLEHARLGDTKHVDASGTQPTHDCT